jgi:hypothetical protein
VSNLHWSWLALPYVVCAVMLLAVVLVGVVLRGDQVMRIGVIGSAVTAIPWSVCSALAACTYDMDLAWRLHRLGQGPIALVGPNFMLILLGISGQLERHRWLVRIAVGVGVLLLALCWTTDLTVPGVQVLSSGYIYTKAGPLTDVHNAGLLVWLLISGFISRRSSAHGEKRSLVRIVLAVMFLAAVGSVDMATVHNGWGAYPIAWLPAIGCAGMALYLELYTDLLRRRGIDRGAVIELITFAIATCVIGAIAALVKNAMPLSLVAISSVVWVIALAAAWAVRSLGTQKQSDDRALETFVVGLTDVESEAVVLQKLTSLWKTVAIDVRTMWRADGDDLVALHTKERWNVPPGVIAWFVSRPEAVAPSDLTTIRLGVLRPALEATIIAHGATLVIPLVDRDTLVALVEADLAHVLREDERDLVIRSARAAARQLTYAGLAHVAVSEGATAREVEVAEAMRLQASASRDDELGRWTVAAEYRTALRTTGAGWSASLLADGRLAVLVTEAGAHGVSSALATAAITGAFAAATATSRTIELDDLLSSLRASADGVMRGGEPIAAFIAMIDGDRQQVSWATAGHPGAFVVGPVAYDLASFPMGSGSRQRPAAKALGGGGAALGASLVTATRGISALPSDSLLVIASTNVRGVNEDAFVSLIRDQAPAGPRLAQVLVETATKRGPIEEDLLAVVVRQRPDRRSEPVARILTPVPD